MLKVRNVFAAAVGLMVLLAGCRDNASGPGEGQNVLVQVTASATGGSGPVHLSKGMDAVGTLGAIDSLRVDGAVVVLKDIVFKPAIDGEHARDSVETEREDESEDHEGEMHKTDGDGHQVHFKGPFVVSLKDTTPVQIALDTIPPGTYNGIKFVVHKLRSKDISRNPALPDSLVGYSIVVAGSFKSSGGDWTSFLFKTDIDEEFKAKGNFVVSPGDILIPYVLKFDLASWFKGPYGRILDPNDSMDRRWIRYAIKASLKGGLRCGRDRDHNGDPD
jgi:hypothetical protein